MFMTERECEKFTTIFMHRNHFNKLAFLCFVNAHKKEK